MGLAVITVASGGLAVAETPGGMPITESTRGIAVTKVVGQKFGLPVKYVSANNGPVTPAFTTWNPADKSPSITLSNGNLSVKGTGSGTSYGVRAISSKTSGKYYFESVVAAAVENIGPGIALASANINNAAGFPGMAIVNLSGGNICINGTFPGSVDVYGVGDTCCTAVDLDNKKIWYRKNAGGLWNAIAGNNPATNTGGFDISFVSTNPVYPLTWISSALTSVMTTNFGASAFVGAVPAGFTAGWPG